MLEMTALEIFFSHKKRFHGMKVAVLVKNVEFFRKFAKNT